MKKVMLLVAVLATSLAAMADGVTPIQVKKAYSPNKQYTNVYEKVPLEHTYVGYAGIELLSPSFFGDGGVNFGVVTSHGYMVTNSIFIGAGAGYMADFRYDKGVIPVFAEGRYFFQSQYQRRIYPHIGLRAGASIATEGGAGFLGQLCVGFRIPLAETFAINLEVGPQYSTKYRRAVEHPGLQVTETGTPFKADGYFFGFFARLNFEF